MMFANDLHNIVFFSLLEPEDTEVLRVILRIFNKLGRRPSALQAAIRLNDIEEIRTIYKSCTDR